MTVTISTFTLDAVVPLFPGALRRTCEFDDNYNVRFVNLVDLHLMYLKDVEPQCNYVLMHRRLLL